MFGARVCKKINIFWWQTCLLKNSVTTKCTGSMNMRIACSQMLAYGKGVFSKVITATVLDIRNKGQASNNEETK